MASPFTIELSMNESPAEAQTRVADAFAEPAQAVGLRLTERSTGELKYGPRVQFPFLIMLWHKLSGEKMTVKVGPADGGGTWVTISGGVARAKHRLAADPEHWTEALGLRT